MNNLPKLIKRGLNTASESASDALRFAGKNPGVACVAVAGAGGAAMLVTPAVVVAPAIGILNLVGFGSGGVVVGKIPIHPEFYPCTMG
jgi:hypothetical protein